MSETEEPRHERSGEGGMTPYSFEPLTGPELFDLRTRWTARNATPAAGVHELQLRLNEAQYDIARLLRHLGAFTGPPEINQ